MQAIQAFKQNLIRMKADMERRIHAIDSDMSHKVSADWEEQAVEREGDEVLASLGNASSEQLAQINAALQRIEDGEYFFCEECGALIPPDRLELLPFTSLCVSCAEKHETSQE